MAQAGCWRPAEHGMAETAEDDDLLFLDEDSADAAAAAADAPAPPWVVLIVDDDADVHAVTRAVIADIRFRGRPLQVLNAYSGKEAQALLASRADIAVMLLDVVMESDDAGLQTVRHVREVLGNHRVRIVLRTGQPGQAPEREVIVDYDINDYKSKTELTAQKLFTTLIAALRSYQDIVTLENAREGLRQIADGAAALFRLREKQAYAEQALLALMAFAGASGGGLFCRDPQRPGDGLRMLAQRHWPAAEEAAIFAELQADSAPEARFDARRILLRETTPDGRALHIYLTAPAALAPLQREQLQLYAAKLAIGFDNVVMHEWLSQTNQWLEEQVAARTRELADKTVRLEIAQARMAEELKLASVLQQSILPHEFPADEFVELSAAMEPANQIGGDFYHLLTVAPDEIAFLIADVSGKGVAAAFFMLRTHALLHEIAASGTPPAACLAEANRRLCQGNPLSLFVTLFLGVLNTRTRRLRYANAGHDMPLLLRQDGSISELPRPSGMLLGMIEQARFAEQDIMLAPGDRLFLFTDGVTEAMNETGEMFGKARLRDCLLASGRLAVAPMMASVMAAVHGFAGGAQQSDDITCMLLGVGSGD